MQNSLAQNNNISTAYIKKDRVKVLNLFKKNFFFEKKIEKINCLTFFNAEWAGYFLKDPFYF